MSRTRTREHAPERRRAKPNLRRQRLERQRADESPTRRGVTKREVRP